MSNLITAYKLLLGLKSVWEHYYSTTMSIMGLTHQTSVGITLHQSPRGIQETCISGQFQRMNEQVLIKVPAENNRHLDRDVIQRRKASLSWKMNEIHTSLINIPFTVGYTG